MKNFENEQECQILIECQLNDKFRRKEIVKKIKSEKKVLLEIEISCLKLYDNIVEHLNQIFQANPLSVYSISIIFNEIELTEQIYKAISTNIKYFINLKELDIELSSVSLKDKDIQSILYEIVDLDLLTSLSINVSNNDDITNECAQYFGLSISQLTHLKKLSLNFNACSQIDNIFIDKFSSITKRMISLEELNLHISNTSINDFTFLSNISLIQNIQTVSLSYEFINIDSMNNFIQNIDNLKSNVSSLSLQISNKQIQNEEDKGNQENNFFKQLGIKLNQFIKLKELYLSYDNSKIININNNNNNKNNIYFLLSNMLDQTIKGLKLYINTNEQKNSNEIINLTNHMQLQYLRTIAFIKNTNSSISQYLEPIY